MTARDGPLSRLSTYQTDVLFLLIGANPLPNYVSARLLSRPDAALFLLHSEENKGTYAVAERLKTALQACRPDLTIFLRSIPRADPSTITMRMKQLLKEVPDTAVVGLNYTGGTKPMAVIAYHTLRQAYTRGGFSYLDAATLELVVDFGENATQRVPVGQEVVLDFQTLFSMHGYTLERPRQTANHTQFCRAMAEVHSTPEGFRQWREWLKTLGNTDPVPRLPTLEQYPALGPAVQGLAGLCGGTPVETTVAQALGYSHLSACSKFLSGGWLEEYTFAALSDLVGPLPLDDYGIALRPRKPSQDDFEIDLAALWGYQLFALACMVTEKKGPAKEHLFEVFVRARQVGGEEARCALVCCVPKPASLQAEIEETWDAEGKIRVFGREQLLNLPAYLESWFRTANRGV